MNRYILIIVEFLKRIIRLILLLVKSILIFLFLPFYSLIRAVNPIEVSKERSSGVVFWKTIAVRITLVLVSFFVVFPVWTYSYVAVAEIFKQQVGYSKDKIFIAGTGSMYPTFPKGVGKDPVELSKQIVSSPGMFPYPNGLVLNGIRFGGYALQRGDIVVVEDENIRKITKEITGQESGWVKRLIALPGDTVELRNGIVYLNELPQKEQYTASAHSTFGESFLPECKEVKVPDDSIFVMGDNRKGSGDSREIGFIPVSSVNHVLPYGSQTGVLDGNWRNTDNDLEESSKIKINKDEYVELLNEKRLEAGVSELKYQSKLEASADKRGSVILKYDDFSFEATRSGYTMERAMKDSNYSNIIWGEVPIQGYYEAQELIENQFEFPTAKKFLLDPDFDEIGIAEVQGEINNCPTQVVVLHLAGYVPPNYDQSTIDSWKNGLARLKEIQPGWAGLTEYKDFYEKYKTDIDRINEIIRIRIGNFSRIITRMEANEWFSNEEKQLIENDSALSDEQNLISDKINKNIKDYY